MRTAVVQMRSTPDVAANLDSAQHLTLKAVERGAQCVLLPEAFAFIGPDALKQEITEPLPGGGPILERCQAIAAAPHAFRARRISRTVRRKRQNVQHLRAPRSRTARSVSMYRKIHLFDVDLPDGTRLNESDRTLPGSETVVTQTPFGLLGSERVLRRPLSRSCINSSSTKARSR